MSRRPGADEYAPYYDTYIRLVPDGDIGETLARQADETLAVYRGVSENQAGFRYAPDKWSLKQVLGHLADTERVFQFRALAFARGARDPLPSMDQNEYMAGVDFDARGWTSLIDELKAVRGASIALFRSLTTDDVLDRRGVASSNEVTVRALGYIIAGHERHHVNVIRERYLAARNYPSR